MISLRDVRRRFGKKEAVAGVTLEIAQGEMVGYIGPNGAGKSTTIKMLTGILTPTSGEVRVAGLDPVRRRIQLAKRIGVVFGQRTQLWWDLPLRDSFDLLQHMYKVPADRHRANLDAFVDMLEMEAFLATPVRQLSLGQRMRGELTAALLHDPQVLFLDEPTIGLDVVAKAAVREFLARVNRERAVTVLLTTHDLADIERLCRRVVVLDEGRVLHDGELAAFVAAFGGQRTLVVDLEEPVPALDVAGARVTRVEGPRQWLALDAPAGQVVAAVAAIAPIVDLTVQEPAIEDVVRRLYGRPSASDRPSGDTS